MNTIEFESAQHVKIEYELATTFQRTAAAVLDLVTFVIYMIIISLLLNLSNVFTEFGTELFVTLLIIKIPWIFYNPLLEFVANGQTLGKHILGIRVVTLEGERPGLKEVFTRWLFKGDFFWISADFFVLLWLGFGLLGIIFSATAEKRQRLGDVMANTVVIKNKSAVVYSLKDVLSIKSQNNYQPVYTQVTRFTDEDMLLIKNTIQRVQRYPNPETKKFAIELADETARLLGLEQTPPKRMEFLQTLLQDYVVLTR
jgi:uncharacterized RDD family membrane protein YckC